VAVEIGTKAVIPLHFGPHGEQTFNNLQADIQGRLGALKRVSLV
jgi:hypothetical protein